VEPLIIVGVVAIIVVVVVIGYIAAQKRREAMAAVAGRLGLRFQPRKNRSLARQYRFLDKLRQGQIVMRSTSYPAVTKGTT